jgi:hypothetical protein
MEVLTVDVATFLVNSIRHSLPTSDLACSEDARHLKPCERRAFHCQTCAGKTYTRIAAGLSADRAGFCELEATLRGSLRVILDIDIAGHPDAIALLRRAHPCQGRHEDSVLKFQMSHLQGLEQCGALQRLEAARRDSGRHLVLLALVFWLCR